MTREYAVEQCYLAALGGRPSTDVNVERVDVDNYFNAALGRAIEDEFKERYSMSKRMGDGEYTIEVDFTKTVELTVSETSECRSYADIPVKIMALPGHNGLKDVYTKDYATQLVKTKSAAESIGLDLPVSLYWLGKSTDGADRVFLHNPPADELVAQVVVSPESYGDDDELVVPYTVLDKAILVTTNYIAGERAAPEDEAINLVDEA